MWNDLEAMLYVLMCAVSGLHHRIWREVTTRIHGLDGVLAIIKRSITERYGISEASEMFADFADTIAAATQYRSYRDTAIHSRIVDVDHSIGEMTFRRNRIEEILLSEDALSKLYDHMFALRREIMEMIGFFQAIESLRSFEPDGSAIPHLIMERFHSGIAAMDEGQYAIFSSDPPNKQLLAQEVVSASARYQGHQHQRKALPPLPSFPEIQTVARGLGALRPVPPSDLSTHPLSSETDATAHPPPRRPIDPT